MEKEEQPHPTWAHGGEVAHTPIKRSATSIRLGLTAAESSKGTVCPLAGRGVLLICPGCGTPRQYTQRWHPAPPRSAAADCTLRAAPNGRAPPF
eukprot:scaffold9731_cov113-Isochrysis_galbana.AAC.5